MFPLNLTHFITPNYIDNFQNTNINCMKKSAFRRNALATNVKSSNPAPDDQGTKTETDRQSKCTKAKFLQGHK